MDPTFTVLTCIQTYLDKERPLLQLLVDIQHQTHSLSSMLQRSILFEQLAPAAMFQPLEKCRWSYALRSHTTALTLQGFSLSLAKKLVRCLDMHVSYVRKMLRGEDFKLPYAPLKTALSAYHLALCEGGQLRRAIEGVSSTWTRLGVVDEHADDAFLERRFNDYDQKCLTLKKIVEIVLESQMNLDTIRNEIAVDLEPYEIYANL